VGVVEGIMATKRDWRFGRFRGEEGHKRLWRDFSMARACLIVTVVIALTLAAWWLPRLGGSAAREPIRVGILHSFSGTMAISERSVAEATLLAIEEINATGGLLGRVIEPVVADGQSNAPTFAAEAQRLIAEAQVQVIFGCWTSASRKSVMPVVEHSRHLLFYPVQYEGLEASPHIVYTGSAPNQQILPGVKWAFDHLGKDFFLVGSDYVFPRTANAIIKDQLAALRGRVVGEEYVILGSTDMREVVHKIVRAQPAVILNTINGDSNVAFFRELRAAGVTPERIPTMSFSIAEQELQTLGVREIVGDYAAWSYFQSVERPDNASFVQRFKEKYGADRVTDDPIEAGYFGVYLWAQAVRDAGAPEPAAVRRSIGNQSFTAPQGIVYVDAENQHTWKTVRIGKVREDGQFAILWTSERSIRPLPYPAFRLKPEWETFLDGLYRGWGGDWANPGT
jgi:urea transport system substrate-binding protein